MAVRRRMVTDEILCSTKFLNLHRDTQMLYIFLLLFSDDDGIVEPFPAMRIAGFYNTAPLEELVEKEFIYLLDDDMLSFIVHFHNQNRISPSKKVDSRHLPKLIEKCPELQFKIVVSTNKNCQNPYSQILDRNRKKETESKNLPKEINKERNKERIECELTKEKSNYIPLPPDTRELVNRLRSRDSERKDDF